MAFKGSQAEASFDQALGLEQLSSGYVMSFLWGYEQNGYRSWLVPMY